MRLIVTIFLLCQVRESMEKQDCLPGTFWNNVRCAECPVKYYQHLAGQNFCFACPEDRATRGTGSYMPQQCLCDYGSHTSGYWCIKCPRGTYSDELGLLTTCKPCPASTSTLQEGSIRMDQCLSLMQLQNCPVGNYFDAISGTCKICPKGTYQDEEGKSQCNACTPSTTTVQEGSTDISQCVCDVGHYRHAVSSTFSWCERCPYDHYQDEMNQNTCKQCPTGTKAQVLGATSTNQCVAAGVMNPVYCPAGEYLERLSSTCLPCPRGTFNNMDGFNVCMRCSSLMTTRSDGSKSQLDCVCGPGTFLQQWCQNCAPGQYQDEYGQSSCKPCPERFSTGGAGANSADQCTQRAPTEPTSRCELGHFLSMSGQCLWCTIGSYQDDRDSATCKPCPPGTTTLSVGATHIEACLPINSGNLSPNPSNPVQGNQGIQPQQPDNSDESGDRNENGQEITNDENAFTASISWNPTESTSVDRVEDNNLNNGHQGNPDRNRTPDGGSGGRSNNSPPESSTNERDTDTGAQGAPSRGGNFSNNNEGSESGNIRDLDNLTTESDGNVTQSARDNMIVRKGVKTARNRSQVILPSFACVAFHGILVVLTLLT